MFYDHHGREDPNGAFELRDGRLILRKGGHVGASIYMMDTRSRSTEPNPRDGVEAARRAWLEDKRTAYRSDRAKAADTSAESSPAPRLGSSARSGVERAREAWLADKRTAYRGR